MFIVVIGMPKDRSIRAKKWRPFDTRRVGRLDPQRGQPRALRR
jgi:hypothetical protein